MPHQRPARRPAPPALRRACTIAAVWSVASGAPAQPSTDAERPGLPVVLRTERVGVEVSAHARGLEFPWALAFLPDGRMLVTERPGRLRLVERDGTLSVPLAGVPPVFAQGEGGLLDVVLSPDFATDRTLFLSYAEPAGPGGRLAVARAGFDGTSLNEVRTIFRQDSATADVTHWGGRLAFDRAGALFVTLGDRRSGRDAAPRLDRHAGKVLRILPDGGVPPDNPFVGRDGARPEIWSSGHRNPQGAALHPSTGRLWTHEHGPRGGDEVNVTRAGRDFGWPRVSFGRDDAGAPIGDGPAPAGVVAPIVHWSPSIAPSGMAFYQAERFGAWKGDLLVGALRARSLYRLELDGETVIGQERMLDGLGRRIRDVRIGPDGLVYLLTDESDGAILRLAPR